MEALIRDRRLRLFKATDAYALEAYRACRSITGSHDAGLAREIRRSAVRSGGAVVAASAFDPGADEERDLLERARRQLIEARYYIYLARRIGLFDVRRYRALTARQDSAIRELEAVLERPALAAASK